MIVVGPLWGAWKRWRQGRTWEQKRREFVYLDEVSVTSLVAARDGSVIESFKDTISATSAHESTSSLGVPVTQLAPSASLTSRTSMSKTTSQEVLRRAVVQGTFRGLRIGDTDLRLSVEDQRPRARPPAARTSIELARYAEKLSKQRRAVRVADLRRGEVLETRVRLRAERIYELTAAITEMLQIVDGKTELFGLETAQVDQVRLIIELLPRLLVDLVPVSAVATSHRLVSLNEEEWLVDAAMIQAGSDLDRESSDFVVAGVTEWPLYWKDVRRVLFADAEYTTYVRVATSGLRPAWSPVKLADVFGRVVPELGDQLRALPLMFDVSRQTSSKLDTTSAPDILRERGLIPFARQLALLTGRKIDEVELAQAADLGAGRVTSIADLAEVGLVRSAFTPVVAAVEASEPHPGEPIDREIVRLIRETHQAIARLEAAASMSEAGQDEPLPAEVAPRLLEVEFVAIYW